MQTNSSEKTANTGFFSRIWESFRASFEKRREGIEAPLYDILAFLISFLFSRCHIIFGAHPLSLGLVAVLPSRVWIAALGVAIGSLTLGRAGIVYAVIAVIVVFLRVIISGQGKDASAEEGALFKEGMLLRMASAVIGGFIAAAYEVLLNGFSLTSVAFGVSMIILPPLVAFALSGVFELGISPGAIFLGTGELFSVRRSTNAEKYSIIFFQGSALFALFLLSLSLKEYELLGISAGYIFASLVTIFVARRFGALRGAAVGFATSVGLSGTFSVAFTLVGLGVGAFHSLGLLLSVVIGGVLLSLWAGYTEGVIGFLSIFPEYAISAAISVPLFKKIKLERSEEELASAESIAEDMVGTMALSYKSRYTGSLDILSSAFSSIENVTKGARERDSKLLPLECERIVSECINEYFDTSPHIPNLEHSRAAFLKSVDSLTTIVYSNKAVTREDFNTPPHLDRISEAIAKAINNAVSTLLEEKFEAAGSDSTPEDFGLISSLLGTARSEDSRERTKNSRLTELARDALSSLGMSGFCVSVFGERRPHIILALEDEAGTLITSPEVISKIEGKTGFKLGKPEYYRRGKMALMEVSAAPKYKITTATLSTSATEEPSGDSSESFDTGEMRHFSLIADGMGSGELARCASQYASELLLHALEFGDGIIPSLSLVNNLLKQRPGECSSSLDLFSFDLISGEGAFYKCGAAPSYIKRHSSLYRIRSRTQPLGLSLSLDAEKIRTEIADGDYIIMFSDGISEDGEDPWLVELISRSTDTSPEALAEAILMGAKENTTVTDDLTVLVGRVSAL